MNQEDAFQYASVMSGQTDDIVLVVENCDGCSVIMEEEMGEIDGGQIIPARYLHSEMIV